MDEQCSLILCQKNVQELFTVNSRLEKKLELQDNKISQISLLLAQRNEDLLSTIEKYTPLKQFREENTHLRNYLDQKTKAFQAQFDQLQSYNFNILRQLLKQMSLLKEENTQYHQNTVEKVGRMTNTVLFQMESIEKKIHSDTAMQIEELTKKSGEMEQNFMKLFQQKHKLIEKLALSQETQIAKINVFENTLSNQLSTISKFQTGIRQTPQQSVRKLNFESAGAEVPLDMLRRQEDALNYMTVSIKNIEKKLAETESKPKLKRELSFDQFSVQWSQQKPQHSQNQSLPASQLKPILVNKGINELGDSQMNEKSARSDLAQNVADPLQREIRSPAGQQQISEISKSPILNKVSPKPIIASPTPNLYEDIRMQQEYEYKMQQIKEQEEKSRLQKQRQQQEYENKLSNLKKSQSLLSNDSSMLKNDSYFLKQEVQIGRNDSQEIKKSSSGLRSLMERSKEREQQSNQQSKTNLNLSNQQKRSPYPQKIESPTKQQLAPVKNQMGASGGRKSRSINIFNLANQMRNLAQQQLKNNKQDQSADEIVYQLDEDGYLMDENGNYLLDERGNYIQISDKDLEELKKQNLVVEQD